MHKKWALPSCMYDFPNFFPPHPFLGGSTEVEFYMWMSQLNLVINQTSNNPESGVKLCIFQLLFCLYRSCTRVIDIALGKILLLFFHPTVKHFSHLLVYIYAVWNLIFYIFHFSHHLQKPLGVTVSMNTCRHICIHNWLVTKC